MSLKSSNMLQAPFQRIIINLLFIKASPINYVHSISLYQSGSMQRQGKGSQQDLGGNTLVIEQRSS